MYTRREVHENYGRAPRRNMWKSRRGSSSGCKSSPCRLLLANDEGGLQEVCSMLQAVSAARRLAKAPPEELKSIYSPWPFHTWGIDILGPFPLAVRQMKYLVVAIEYFTKWIEAEPVAQITAHKIESFVWSGGSSC